MGLQLASLNAVDSNEQFLFVNSSSQAATLTSRHGHAKSITVLIGLSEWFGTGTGPSVRIPQIFLIFIQYMFKNSDFRKTGRRLMSTVHNCKTRWVNVCIPILYVYSIYHISIWFYTVAGI